MSASKEMTKLVFTTSPTHAYYVARCTHSSLLPITERMKNAKVLTLSAVAVYPPGLTGYAHIFGKPRPHTRPLCYFYFLHRAQNGQNLVKVSHAH